MKQGDSDRASHYYSMMPSLKRTKDKGKKRGGGGGMRPLPNKQQSMIQTPAPDQVTSDLIDATCHEILSLEGDEGPDGSYAIPSVASFAILAKRLDHYLGQLSVLKDDNVRTRLLLAKLVIDVCVRSAYPSDDDEGKDDTDTKIPSLIEMTEDEWNSLARELGLVAETVSFSFESSELSEPLNSLISQVEALGALATLRSQLSSGISEIEEDDANTPSKKKVPKTFFSNLQDAINQYKQTAEKIYENHENIDKNLFVPDAMLKIKRNSTVQRTKSTATSFLERIDELVAKKAFPLKHLQLSLLALLKKLEKELPVPKLFQLGYFGNGSSSTPPTSAAPTKKITSTSPVSPSATSSSSGQVISQREARKQTKKPEYRDKSDSEEEEEEEEETPVLVEKKNGTKRKNEKNTLTFDSDSGDDVELKVAPSKKKVRRVPYSEEEKGALLQGVEEFGKGNWAKIRDHYADIFGVNKRTAVNLKDLYRTLTK
jgi:hypothetical protein